MNAPGCFSETYGGILGDYRDLFAIPYLDDVILFSDSFEDHVEHLRKVLRRFRERGLKLKLGKCGFFKHDVKFLGRIVARDGYSLDDDSKKAVTALRDFTPTTIGHILHLLGLLGYHRRHVKNSARIAKPLTDLLLVKPSKPTNKSQVSSKEKIVWTEECQAALEELVHLVTSAPILAYPDFTKDFVLHTDASGLGLGVFLCQEQDEQLRVIGYGSCTLKPAEAKYHSTKLELLAVKWAVCEKFRDYLGYANHFEIFTDNNPVTYVMSISKVNASTHRWISELSELLAQVIPTRCCDTLPQQV